MTAEVSRLREAQRGDAAARGELESAKAAAEAEVTRLTDKCDELNQVSGWAGIVA